MFAKSFFSICVMNDCVFSMCFIMREKNKNYIMDLLEFMLTIPNILIDLSHLFITSADETFHSEADWLS